MTTLTLVPRDRWIDARVAELASNHRAKAVNVAQALNEKRVIDSKREALKQSIERRSL